MGLWYGKSILTLEKRETVCNLSARIYFYHIRWFRNNYQTEFSLSSLITVSQKTAALAIVKGLLISVTNQRVKNTLAILVGSHVGNPCKAQKCPCKAKIQLSICLNIGFSFPP